MHRYALSLLISPLVLLISLGTPARGNAQGQPLLYTVPFRAGESGYLIYRIPAVWTAPNKPLLAFAEARKSQRRAAGNIDLVLRRSLDGGQTWQPLQVIADPSDDFCGNPCVAYDPMNKRLWVAFTRSPGSATEEQIVGGKAKATEVWITHSDDDGTTWSDPRNLSATARRPDWGWYGTGPGHGLFLGNASNGRLVIPAYHTAAGVYRTHTVVSDDWGKSWRIGGVAADHTSEPQIVVMGDQSLLMNARTIAGKGENRTWMRSRDRGDSWQSAIDVASIPENLCQGCIYRTDRPAAKDRHDLIFTQPSVRRRAEVHALLSEDDGRSWPFGQPLWRGPSAYTAMVRMHDGSMGLLLECGVKDPYEQIAFMKFSPEWLRGKRVTAINPKPTDEPSPTRKP